MESWHGQTPAPSPPALGRGQGCGKCGKAHMGEELMVHWSKVSFCWGGVGGPSRGGGAQ